MKYSVGIKFIAIILCACSLVAVAFSGIGIAFMEGYDLYHSSLESVQQTQVDQIGKSIAWHYAQDYAAQHLSNAPVELREQLNHNYFADRQYGKYTLTIYENGEEVSSRGSMSRPVKWVYRETVRPSYPVVMGQYYMGDNGIMRQTETASDAAAASGMTEEAAATDAGAAAAKATEATQPMDEALARVAGQEALYSEEHHSGYWYDPETGRGYNTVYSINYYQGPEYEIEIRFADNVGLGAEFMLITALYPYRDYFIPVLLASLAAFAVCIVFLCTVAGRNKQGEVKLAAINRIPLDLYAVCMVGMMVLLFLPIVWLFESAYYNNLESVWDNPMLCLLICCLCGLGISLCAIGYLYAFAAQVKASNNYWLRHTVVGWAVRNSRKILVWAWGAAIQILRLALKLARWLLRGIGRGVKLLGKGFRMIGRGIQAVLGMLPVMGEWLATAAAMVVVPIVTLFFAAESHGFGEAFWTMICVASILGCILLVVYGGWCFGTLLKGIKTMCEGDLNKKIDTQYLYGSFREFGEELNDLAEAAKEAARQQMKSERMKTELITNVSHDIKTPLTSIINFVDLLQKPHSPEEGAEYLAVLDRQSQRLKKLIDDLMDMSKASSGSMTVELGEVDAAEAVNQALGEFGDKLERAGLTPVFRHPDKSILMVADGKLLWRVLSNLLNNAVKYALPDTRLYVDLMETDGNAVISIKNISREQLNVDAEELMERFVRGDASRNTEGSGLGLNIAKSLVELQGGTMHLTVDGDLFKVTLMFPQV